MMLRAKPPADWLDKVKNNLPAVLVDHAHLERKAATTALSLEKYKDLYPRVEELNAIAIEELQHFQLVLNLLKTRGIPFGHACPTADLFGRDGRRRLAEMAFPEPWASNIAACLELIERLRIRELHEHRTEP